MIGKSGGSDPLALKGFKKRVTSAGQEEKKNRGEEGRREGESTRVKPVS
jgi:hypothetical protein